LVRSGDRVDTGKLFDFVKTYQAVYPVELMCRLLGVSPSGYYAWCQRGRSTRDQADEVLRERIKAIHRWSDGTYGVPRILEELRGEGTRISGKRVARLMRQERLQGVSRRPGIKTTRRGVDDAPAADLVRRDFTATAPNQLWVADITWVPTWAGFLYLAVVLDAFSRKIVGWAMASHLRTELVLQALDMALEQRQPQGVIHHSDHGCQYTSLAFGTRCQQAGVRPSRGTVGDCFDNALCESFFATLECELIDRRSFHTQTQAQQHLFRYIEGWYNLHRRHSALDYLSPINYEKRYHLSA
jgi:putative transposase